MHPYLGAATKTGGGTGLTAVDWTAIGTIVLAALTLATLITTIIITVRDRRSAEARLEAARDQERDAQAWAVQVFLAVDARETVGGVGTVLIATVVNDGAYTLTRLEAMFSPDGRELVPPASHELVPVWQRPIEVQLGVAGHGDNLVQGMSMRFSCMLPGGSVGEPYAIVRWTDRWGQVWQLIKGHPEKIKESDPWPRW